LLVAGALLLGSPWAIAEDLPAPADAGLASSSELAARLDALTAELAQVEADLPAGEAAVRTAETTVAATTTTYESAVHARDDAVARLGRYSVSAYIGGGVGTDLTDAVLHGPSLDLDAEGRHAMAATVRTELADAARQTLRRLDAATGALDRDEAGLHEARRRFDDLSSRRAALGEEIEATRAAIVRAEQAEKDAEDQARAKAADDARARRLDLRPGTHRPLSVHSGVVPPRSVSADVAIKLGAEIPPTALDAYWRAMAMANAARSDCLIDWALVAAIGKVETSHGTYGGTIVAADGSTSPTILGIPLDGSAGVVKITDTDGGVLDGDPEFDRAVGPMQFIPSTWRSFAADGNGDGSADPHNVYDAALAAAKYLCHAGGGQINDPVHASQAVYSYNHSTAYNIEVLTLADHYRRVLDPTLPPPTTPPTVTPSPDPLVPPASPDDPGTPSPTSTSSTTTTTSLAPPTTVAAA
jgi:membrane-bound lytic murein transglycosylase B